MTQKGLTLESLKGAVSLFTLKNMGEPNLVILVVFLVALGP